MRNIQFLLLCYFMIAGLCYKYNLPQNGNGIWPKQEVFQAFKNSSFTGKVYLRGESGYQPFTINNFRKVPQPAVIIQPITVDDVIKGLSFAQQNNIRISVQSTGRHQDQRNIYDNSIHFDLSLMNNKSINLAQKTLTLGPGNNWGQIVNYLVQQTNDTLIAACGDDPGVGIYGWTAGGGHGRFTKLFGLGADNLLSVNVVLANLTVVTASTTQNPDLFRAIRGAGGPSFGIVTSLTVKLFENQGTFYKFDASYSLDSSIATTFGNWLINAPNYVAGYYQAMSYLGYYVTVSAHCFAQKNNSQCANAFDALKKEALQTGLTNFTSYYQHLITKQPVTQAAYVLGTLALNQSNIIYGLTQLNSLMKTVPGFVLLGDAVTGGVSNQTDLNQDTTTISPSYRQSIGVFAYGVAISPTTSNSDRATTLAGFNQATESFKQINDFVYWNIPQHDFPSNDWQARYWGGQASYKRLLILKKQLDPNNFYNCYHCIGYNETQDEIDSFVCPSVDCSCTNTPSGNCAQYSPLSAIKLGRVFVQLLVLALITIFI